MVSPYYNPINFEVVLDEEGRPVDVTEGATTRFSPVQRSAMWLWKEALEAEAPGGSGRSRAPGVQQARGGRRRRRVVAVLVAGDRDLVDVGPGWSPGTTPCIASSSSSSSGGGVSGWVRLAEEELEVQGYHRVVTLNAHRWNSLGMARSGHREDFLRRRVVGVREGEDEEEPATNLSC